MESIEQKINFILNEMYQPDIYQSYFCTYLQETPHKNEDPGYLFFYTKDISENQIIKSQKEDGSYIYGNRESNPNVDNQKIEMGIVDRDKKYKRPQEKHPSTEFITLHDTGSQKNGKNWNIEIQTSDREVSWHFTIDENEVYQHIPIDEVAYHAGDRDNVFGLNDTGIKFSVSNPKIEFNFNDKFLYINDQKSILKIPEPKPNYYNDPNYLNDPNYFKITEAGLYVEKGGNGNYFINNYYFNKFFKRISNGGGNHNSIGIESCIYDGVCYSKIMRIYANLVAHLLNMNNLTVNRVMLHRSFSGKMCPQSMIRNNVNSPFNLNKLKKMIFIEDYIYKNLPNCKFIYCSHNLDLLDNYGFLLKYVDKITEISYDVTVEYEGIKIFKNFKTKIHPIEN